jgi:hypothetical protein
LVFTESPYLSALHDSLFRPSRFIVGRFTVFYSLPSRFIVGHFTIFLFSAEPLYRWALHDILFSAEPLYRWALHDILFSAEPLIVGRFAIVYFYRAALSFGISRQFIFCTNSFRSNFANTALSCAAISSTVFQNYATLAASRPARC